MSYVYVFDFGDMVKVGYTTDLRTRKASVQCVVKKRIVNVFSIPAPIEVESLAHKQLSNFRIQGEYFNCSFEVACLAVKRASEETLKQPRPFIDNKIKFTMIIPREMAQKLDYIRVQYGRSRIKEIEMACKEWIYQFEKENGEIDIGQ